jgi:ABC-type lipoprotein release transport system permease subunit
VLAAKLAVRNLVRNRWRSGLTLGGIAVAVGLMVWTLAFYEGWIAEMVRGATAVETGQIQIQPAGWVENPRIYRALEVGPELLEAVDQVPGVRAASPRIEAGGLVGNEERSRVGRIIGVLPEREAAATPVAQGVVDGRWLAAAPRADTLPREVVLGEGMARNLRVGVGAELVVFLEAADGSLGNELLEVVGTVRTGNTAVDRMGAYLHLDDARRITALEGRAHVVVLRTDDPDRARATAREVADRLDLPLLAGTAASGLPDDAPVVRPWQAIAPALDEMILLMRRSYWFVYLIVYLVAAVGILNTQRMSALEREREFGVLLALGVKPRRMFGMVQVETVMLGLAGAALGGLLGFLVSWYHATAGLDMSLLTSQASFSYMGVAFRDRIYTDLSVAAVAQPVLVMLFVALVSGLWPALKSALIQPAATIAGRNA